MLLTAVPNLARGSESYAFFHMSFPEWRLHILKWNCYKDAIYVTNTATEIMGDFRKAYPLSVKGPSVDNFLILRDGAPFLTGLPYPSLSTIRDFALYAGTSDSAIRTLLSREGKAGYIRKEKDEAGTMRYRLSEPSLVLSMVNSRQSWLPEGFIVAVFSFTVDATSERSIVRETLRISASKRSPRMSI